MVRLIESGARALRRAACCAAVAAVPALAGCGGIATVGSTVFSGAEAVGTLVKKSVNEEDKTGDNGAAAPN